MKQRRSFSPEFRQEAVRLALASDRPLSEVARELQIRPDQLRHWKQQLTRAAGGPPPSGETPEQELRRLRREVEVLRQERDFLKKAAAFFAKESR
jgi:transposase-like protein